MSSVWIISNIQYCSEEWTILKKCSLIPKGNNNNNIRSKWHWQLNMHKLFTVCTEQVRSPYTELAASGLPNPTHLEGEVRFDQAQDKQVVTTRSPRIVTEGLLTHSMLIKMYVYATYSRFRIGTILSIRKHGYEFITTLPLSGLMSPFSLSFLLCLVDA